MGKFDFKLFSVDDCGCGMKVCTDSVLLGAWFLPSVSEASVVADAGAGSGLLSLMAAQLCPHARIVAVETDLGSCRAAEANFAASPWQDRLQMLQHDFCSAPLPAADAIVSNPPYFANGALAPEAARAAARHQGSLNYFSLFSRASQLLTSSGQLGFVSPADLENDIIFAIETAGLELQRLCRVITAPGKPARRLLWQVGRDCTATSYETLSLRDINGLPSEQYIALVQDFYLKIA